jgi:hypothetical protein
MGAASSRASIETAIVDANAMIPGKSTSPHAPADEPLYCMPDTLMTDSVAHQ